MLVCYLKRILVGSFGLSGAVPGAGVELDLGVEY